MCAIADLVPLAVALGVCGAHDHALKNLLYPRVIEANLFGIFVRAVFVKLRDTALGPCAVSLAAVALAGAAQ